MRLYSKSKLLSLVTTILLVTTSALADEKEIQVKDLSYGVALYNFFQDRYFSAINELLVAQERRPGSRQLDDNELLLGSLYLSYGLQQNADRIFKVLVDEKTSPYTRDRAWFNLAKLQYQRGLIKEASQALQHVQDTLPGYRNAERLNLLTNIYLQEHQYDKALATASEFSGSSAWEDYARFNLGVSLVKQGQVEEGTRQLEAVGKIDPDTPELTALRDKANLALGFSLMRMDQPEQASEAFQQVRLAGPLSNKALLGIGWAWNVQHLYEKALVPWLELQNRSPLDPAVQESLLAIPYTMEKINKPKLALVNYNKANQHYEQQLQELEHTITAIQNGELLRALRPSNLGDETALSIYRSKLPKSITVPYIYTLLASEQFQLALNNYQDLLYLNYVLQRWGQYLPTFKLMLQERRRAYHEKLPEVTGDVRVKQLQRLQQERDQLAREVRRIEKQQDMLALATDDELETIELLQSIKQQLDGLSGKTDLSEELAKYRLFYGIVYWQIGSNSVPRIWQLKKNLKELDQALAETKAANASLQSAWNKAPVRFEGFSARIKGKGNHIKRMQQRVQDALNEQQHIIQSLALREVYQQRERLKAYQVRAKFAQARLYDTMSKDMETTKSESKTDTP
jgi:TolA-binding protein